MDATFCWKFICLFIDSSLKYICKLYLNNKALKCYSINKLKKQREKKILANIFHLYNLLETVYSFFPFFLGIPYIFSTGFWYICMIFLFHCYYDFVQHVVKLISILYNKVSFNLALLAKQGWRLLHCQDSLFYRVFKSKYFSDGSFLDAPIPSHSSYAWRSIAQS